jgi:hypothetical protein
VSFLQRKKRFQIPSKTTKRVTLGYKTTLISAIWKVARDDDDDNNNNNNNNNNNAWP